MRTVLYEIYYHDAWRTRTSYDDEPMLERKPQNDTTRTN